MNRRKLVFIFILISTYTLAFSQTSFVYKEIDTTQLEMVVYEPVIREENQLSPAMIFFFGGGWIGGSIEQFEPHAKYFAQRGLVCFLVDYRVKNRQQTTPFESLQDAKSAVRFVRGHANEWRVDTSRIVAVGGSAGGHLAAATAVIEGYNEKTDDLSVNCIPNALVLFNPVIDNGPGGYGFDRIGDQYKDFSPLHNLKKGTPPTIFFLGTEDELIPVETAKYYQKIIQRVGSRCDLYLYNGEGHGFFNYKNFDNYKKTLLETDDFLQSIGYLNPLPVIKIE